MLRVRQGQADPHTADQRWLDGVLAVAGNGNVSGTVGNTKADIKGADIAHQRRRSGAGGQQNLAISQAIIQASDR
ncbi:hypothetical protein D3C71_2066970 [compost metagenome]